MSLSFTIKPGRRYRQRNGNIMRCYATDGGGEFPIHGAEWVDDKRTARIEFGMIWDKPEAWRVNGIYAQGGEPCGLDIVAEVEQGDSPSSAVGGDSSKRKGGRQ